MPYNSLRIWTGRSGRRRQRNGPTVPVGPCVVSGCGEDGHCVLLVWNFCRPAGAGETVFYGLEIKYFG